MKRTSSGRRTRRASIRARVLAIAFIPSFVLLAGGSALAGYLVYDALKDRRFAEQVHEAAEPGARFFAAVREERRLTLQALAAPRGDDAELRRQRAATDQAAAGINSHLQQMVGDVPDDVRQSIEINARQYAELPAFRQQVDAGRPTLQQAFDVYNRIIDRFAIGLNSVAQEAPDAETAYRRVMAMPLFTAADGMSRADALAAAGAAGGGLSDEEFRTYVREIGAYHAQLDDAVPEMIPSVERAYDQLVASPAWQRVTTVENAFIGGDVGAPPIPESQWRAAARDVGAALMNSYIQQSSDATALALDATERTFVWSLAAGAGVLVLSLLVLFVAWRLANRLVRRLETLREDTLRLADEQLPAIVGRVSSGSSVDLDAEVSWLSHGRDEIGQVADAFNKAQHTAISAAVDEAKTREGTKKVFLNIAHRSQVIVHRQLQALDSAERRQEDPDQLEVLFQLDHLSTRARRNAENLIVLGGEQPGRQWRNPVSLTDLVRGATAETEEYKRVVVGKLPVAAVAGPVVGDLVHLLAELIDNATAFSPPTSRVEIRAEVVGRGIAIEVEDQGLGIEQEQRDELNEVLRDPPDFSIMALSEEPRLGLFVVARLAAKHGVVVTLRESAYGGTRAIVLVLSEKLAPVPDEPADATPSRMSMSYPSLPPVEPATGDAVPSQPSVRRRSVSPPQRPPAHPTPHVPQHTTPPRRRLRQPPPEPSAAPSAPSAPSAPQAPADALPPQNAGGSLAAGRPPLPRRRRQEHLAPQLMDGETGGDDVEAEPESPEQARSRLSAFQRGTRRARAQESGFHQPSGD